MLSRWGRSNTQYMLLSISCILVCLIFYTLWFLLLHMEDRLKDTQDWSNITLFLLEALWHTITPGRSQIFSALQRIVGTVLIWHPGYSFLFFFCQWISCLIHRSNLNDDSWKIWLRNIKKKNLFVIFTQFIYIYVLSIQIIYLFLRVLLLFYKYKLTYIILSIC